MENVNTVIASRVVGHDPTRQAEIDRLMIELDGRPGARRRQRHLGKCAVLAVNLEELKGKHLSRYGNPPREPVASLDPRIERLIASINRIFRLVDESRI